MNFDLLIRHAHLATMADDQGLGTILDGSVAVNDGLISWVGRDSELPVDCCAEVEFDAGGCWLTPGLIDCHTHLVWAGNRAQEFEQRLHGKTYQEIARDGGGILSTVRSTRSASLEELVDGAAARITDLMSQGVTTVEVKSGYGLDLETEVKMLEAAKLLGKIYPIRTVPTYLGAHAIPPEFANADEYVKFICETVIPVVAAGHLAQAVDVFCETIAFSLEQTRKVFEGASKFGLQIKLHAEQLTDSGGAGLVAAMNGLSADHVEYVSATSVKQMATAGTHAVLLPGAFYSLRESQVPPIDLFREHGVPMAVATDCNPGTSPCSSLLLMMNMACVLFRMTPTEALLGVTRHAAGALGMGSSLGRLQLNYQADLALFEIDHPRDLSANIGRNPCVGSWYSGVHRTC